MITVKIEEMISPTTIILVGRTAGNSMLEQIIKKHPEINSSEALDKVEIVIPEKIVAINKSWFFGVFETFIRTLGTSKFRTVFQFEASSYIKQCIDDYTDNALLDLSQQEVLAA